MVFLNGTFIEKSKAFVSVMDRGFLFGDAVYEVIPVYNGKIFSLLPHLNRLQKNLDIIEIKNPYSCEKWREILTKLTQFSPHKNQSLYLQITRGTDTIRQHNTKKLTPNIYIESNSLALKSKSDLEKGFCAITREDIRWHRCDIKTTSLLPNVLYLRQARARHVEEVILQRNNQITEGASSNVFMLKGNTLSTHPTGAHILSGITRDLTLKAARSCQIEVQEVPFMLSDMYRCDGLWISSSTREIMPITKVDDRLINHGKITPHWYCVYQHYQQLKNE